MYSIGIDAGSTYTKGVLFDGENISKKLIIPTGSSPKSTSKEVYEYLTKDIDNSTEGRGSKRFPGRDPQGKRCEVRRKEP